jgi:ABC-type nitrate/sulfonate/bicarbonate transport system permease component
MGSRLPSWFGGTVGIAIVIAVWTLLAVTYFHASGAVPTPLAVLRQYRADGFGFYWTNMSVTLRGALLGFAWGNLLALAVAFVVLLLPPLEGVATQLAVISYCTPLTAIGPIVLVVFGGRAPTIFLAGISVFFTTLIGALLGLKAADRAALDVVAAYGGGRLTQLRKVRVIAALPATLSGLKIAAPASLLGAILGEYLGGVDNGLGVVITAAQQNYLVSRTWGLALACGLAAGAGYALIGVIGRLVTPWAHAMTGDGAR